MRLRTILILIAAAAALLPTHAEWVNRGLCHVWDGDGTPDTPEDMLPGVIYDHNRSVKGEYFTYSGIYAEEGKGAGAGKSIKAINKIRSTGAKNPTGSPDVHGQCAYVLKQLMRKSDDILKKLYKYPFSVALSHVYMAPAKTSALENILRGKHSSESDFIADTTSSNTKANAYKNHTSWIGIFKGNVIAPKSMKFRFCAAADDSIIVNFDGNMVLETGYIHPDLYKGNGVKDPACCSTTERSREFQKQLVAGKIAGRKGYDVIALRSAPYTNSKFNGITCGPTISVEEGKAYPIELIISNNGGTALCYLFTQEITSGEMAQLQLFRTSDAPVTRPYASLATSSRYESGPAYDEDSPIWQIKGKKSKKAPKPRNQFHKMN